jgi:hypothetical protein
MNTKHVALAALATGLLTAWSAAGIAQGPPTPDQLVAGLKQNLAESQKRLRQYEWIETTAISLKGEEKSRKQQRVYYGADGKLTKVPVGAAPAQAKAPATSGGRGGRVKERIIENKKEDMQEYMQQAVALIHKYVPPDPALIQKAKDGDKLQVRPPQDGKVRAEFRDFVQKSDLMAIDVDAKALLLAGLNVATYLDKPEDTVTLDVRYNTLADGTAFVARTTFEAKAKNITVVVENSGHRPISK